MAGGEAGNAMGKLCVSRATKIVWVDRPAGPFVVYWNGEMANKSSKRNMCSMLKPKIVKNGLVRMQCLFKPKQNGWWRDR